MGMQMQTSVGRMSLTFGRRTGHQAHARTTLLGLISFVLGVVVSLLIFRTGNRHTAEPVGTGQPPVLSPATTSVLQRLNSKITLHFYSVLGTVGATDPMKAFATRMHDLLRAYEQVGNGKIELVLSQTNLDDAVAAGLHPFSLASGGTGCLGIIVSGDGQKETLGQLSPEWEGAVQFDLTRAIDRLNQLKPAAASPHPVIQNAPATMAEVKKVLPNVDALSLKQGTEMLRAAALRDFASEAQKMEAQVKDARQRLADAQNSNSADEQQAAMKQLQEVQAEQAGKIQEMAARLQAQIAALQLLKQQ